MMKAAETLFFLFAVLVALTLPALPLLQELRPVQGAAHTLTAAAGAQATPSRRL